MSIVERSDVLRLPIGDRHSDPDAETFAVLDKYRGHAAYRVAMASATDVDEAVGAACRALATPLPAFRRYEILMRAAALLDEERDRFVDALITEGGKPHKASTAEVGRAVETLRWSAEEAKRLNGETIPLDASAAGVGRLALTLREPVGVVAAITPTNSPLNLVAHKVGPALAAGNAVVLKPPRATPVCSLLLHDVLQRAGLPAGWLSVVAGPAAADALVSNADVDLYNVTGSAAVGARIRRDVGLRDTLMELGGNSPVIVHGDADVARAAQACVAKGFAGAGQACTSVQRVYVHASVATAFVAALRAGVRALVVGDPRDAGTDVGPMISEDAAQRVESWIDEAVALGGRVHGDRRREGPVLWPVVLDGVPRDARVSCEEVFGPVIVVAPYTALDQAIDAANDTRYGLHAAVFTSSLDVAFTAIRQLDAGGVLVNEATQWRTEYVPFGGVKDSGSGREGPRYAVERMTRTKVAMLALEQRQ